MGSDGNGILTIHLNDYFQCGASNAAVPRRYWGRFQSRIEAQTAAILDLLDDHSAQATFYSSGWIAEHVPDLMIEITRRGHELASTGYYQHSVRRLNADEFREEVVRSRKALERASGQEVIGYRCAGWLKPGDLWALRVLAEEGIQYDSSFSYFGFYASAGVLKAPKRFTFGERRIWEVPISSTRVGGFHFPISGGTYLRQLPEKYLERRIAQWHAREAGPLLTYFQVSELDPDQPRITALPRLRSIQKYRNIPEMKRRVERYLRTYSYQSIASHLGLKPQGISLPEEISDLATQSRVNSVHAATKPVTIVVPCYQEQDAIPYLANALNTFEQEHGADYAISYIFVDDGSQDATLARLFDVFGKKPDATILQHKANKGVMAAIMTGIRAAKTEAVCVIDCDCSYDPAILAKLLPELRDGVSMVTASPYHREGSVLNVPGWRLLLSRGLSVLYQQLLTTKLATYTACCRVYRRSAVADLQLENDDFLGMSEIVAQLDAAGATIVEVPATLEARILGHSKMKTMRTIFAHLRALSGLVQKRFHAPRATIEQTESS